MKLSTSDLVGIVAALTACADLRLPPPRFANAPPVMVVDDRRNVPVAPKRPRYMPSLYNYDGHFHQRVSRAMDVPRHRRALGVNAIDEVPDSTWFTNRIGVRDLSPDEVRVGPVRIPGPETFKPWSVVRSKTGGKLPGFVIRDSRGEEFLIKFEPRGLPELETSAHVIANRLVWAAGFNVPEDHVVYLRREDVVLAPNAVLADLIDGERKMTVDDLQDVFTKVDAIDGRMRVIASRIVAGKVLGGHPIQGVRDDDPNDRIPHELRRDLRGAVALYAWLDHVDLNGENFLDVWAADPANPRQHYVVHYLIDFGKALGGMASFLHDRRTGFEYMADFEDMSQQLVTLGFAPNPWEDRPVPQFRGVGLYDATTYDPGDWEPSTASYRPWLTSDRFDKFWGAKLIVRFTRAQLRAAVEAARLTDAGAADYLAETLYARARKTAKYWFTRVNPLDRFAVAEADAGPALCFDDLMLVHGFAPIENTQYTIAQFDQAERAVGKPSQVLASRLGRTCTGPLALAAGGNGYTIVRVTTRRPGFVGTTDIHLARDPTSSRPRVIGIWRE